MADDATTQADTSPEDEGPSETTTPDQKGTDPQELIASYRKRQAGAEAARQAAERKLADAERELEAFRAKNRTAEDTELSELARLKAKVEDAERRASEAEAKAEARILDARFPNARKELPEVTDEVRLAKFEAMLKDEEPEAEEPPTPVSNNGSRTAAGGVKPAKEETSADILAKLRTMPVPWS